MNDLDFSKFHPGDVSVPPGFHVRWGGSLVRNAFFGVDLHPGIPIPATPPPHEDWFDWHSLFSALDEARGRFVMAELGAGHGRWVVPGGLAARRIGLPFSLICVEAEPSHFATIPVHMQDNGIDPAGHRLLHAAVGADDGEVLFAVGNAQEWWGQQVLPPGDYSGAPYDVARVPCVSLATALDGIDRVDLLHMDIQGTEADVVESSLALIRDRVKRLHIGTHSPEVEARIRIAMRSIGFVPVWDFPCGKTAETPAGRVEFNDGVQAWINKRLRSGSRWVRWLRRQWPRST